MARENIPYSRGQLIVALAIAAAVTAIAMLPNAQQIDDKWLGLFANTSLVFGILLYWSRERLKQASFWIVFIAVLAIHSAIYIVVLRRVAQWPLVNFGVIDVVEWAALGAMFRRMGNRHRHPG